MLCPQGAVHVGGLPEMGSCVDSEVTVLITAANINARGRITLFVDARLRSAFGILS